jgi:hypothetical protein
MRVYCAQWEMGLSKREPSGFERSVGVSKAGAEFFEFEKKRDNCTSGDEKILRGEKHLQRSRAAK